MRKNIIFIVALVFLGTAYIEKMDYTELKQEPVLVVNSFFCTDSLFKVYVSNLTNVLDTVMRPLPDAKVKIFEGENLLETLNYDTNGYYISQNLRAKTNVEYTISVQVVGYPTATAHEKIPDFNIETIDSKIFVDIYESSIPQHKDSKIELTFKENTASNRNYYELNHFSYNYSTLDNNLLEIEEYPSESSSSILLEYYNLPFLQGGNYLFSNNLFDNNICFLNIKLIRTYETDPVLNPTINKDFFIDLKLISDNYFKYQFSIDEYRANSNTESSNVNINQNFFIGNEQKEVFSNIEGGYGIFAGYQRVIIDLEEIYET